MYKKILVPVDESEASMRALQEACKLAQSNKASLEIIHIFDYARFSWSTQGISHIEQTDESSDEILNRAKAMTNKYGVSANTAIIDNTGEKIADIIVRKAQENDCDLIAMGTHGLTGIMHLLMGSVAEGVLRKSKIPVMLIRY